MSSSGLLRSVVLVITDVSGERIAYIIMVARIRQVGTTLVGLATEARCEEILFSYKRRCLQEPQGVTTHSRRRENFKFYIPFTVRAL
jgi:hypothetical protein